MTAYGVSDSSSARSATKGGCAQLIFCPAGSLTPDTYCGVGRCPPAAPDGPQEEVRPMSKARRDQRTREQLAEVTAVLACVTALLYALAALFQLVGPSGTR